MLGEDSAVALGHTDQPVLPVVLLLSLAQSPQRMTLMFGGDVIPHEPLKAVAAMRADGGNNEGWDHLLAPLAPVMADADFTIVNLEAPVVTVKKPESGEFLFSGTPALLHALKRTGVDVATFANNHCLDQHREGITSTRAYLDEAGLRSAGAASSAEAAWTPLVLEKNGLRIALVPFTRFLNGFNNKKDDALPHVPVLQYDYEPIGGSRTQAQVTDLLRTTASQVDAVIVLVHWGAEYKLAPAPEDRKLAKALLDAGAFAVIGHHPHVLQPVEFVTRTDGTRGLVAFSLGNLLSNQDAFVADGLRRDGLLLGLELTKQDGVMRLSAVTPVPIVTEHTTGAAKKRDVQVFPVDAQLASLNARLAELSKLTGPAVKKERAALVWRRRVALSRLARITSFLRALETADESLLPRAAAAVDGVPAGSP